MSVMILIKIKDYIVVAGSHFANTAACFILIMCDPITALE